MKIINGCRRSGKTYKVLEKLTEHDLYVAPTYERCRIAYDNWIELHKPKKKHYQLNIVKQDIRPTFTNFDTFFSKDLRSYEFENVYIEDIELFLQHIAVSNGVRGKITLTAGAIIEQLPVPEDVQKVIEQYGSKGILPEE